MQIKVIRGTHQIGGCIVEIRTSKTRIIIDVGTELPSADGKENTSLAIDGVTAGTADCDAVFVTHYHGDHVGMFANILPEVPIYMGETAKRIFAVVQRKIQTFGKGDPDRVAAFKTFKVGKPIVIKDIKITPYVVDHSAFDAYMLLIEADGKRVLHTGDFRMHGAQGSAMPAVFEKYAKNIDVLITEGTMLSRPSEKVQTEHELGREAAEWIRNNRNVFVLCSATNIDRIAVFYNAAIACRKPVIVCEDDFQQEILRIVTENSRSSFYKFDRPKPYAYGRNLHDFMHDRGFCFIGRTNAITRRAMSVFPDNLLIYSMWRGYLDRAHPACDTYKSDFVENAKASGSRFILLHTSGHATAADLKKICEITQAKTVIPIHCTHPNAFNQLGIASDVKLLQDGEGIII